LFLSSRVLVLVTLRILFFGFDPSHCTRGEQRLVSVGFRPKPSMRWIPKELNSGTISDRFQSRVGLLSVLRFVGFHGWVDTVCCIHFVVTFSVIRFDVPSPSLILSFLLLSFIAEERTEKNKNKVSIIILFLYLRKKTSDIINRLDNFFIFN